MSVRLRMSVLRLRQLSTPASLSARQRQILRRGLWWPARAMPRAIAVACALAALALAPAGGVSVVAQPVRTGLDFPAGFTVARNGAIYYGERFTGEIRILARTTASDTHFFTVPNVASQAPEHGLLGLALHPDYPTTPYVYAFVTRLVSGAVRIQIVRIKNSGGRGTKMKVLFSDVADVHHNGGRILFGPDRRLYVSIGDRQVPASAQDLSSRAGKILRMKATGEVPSDNPIAGSYVFAYGLRNSFGFAFDPKSRRLWASDNGPECNDELNLVTAGGNYAWGASARCTSPPVPPANTNQDGPGPRLPSLFYPASVAPTGVAFCSACRLGADAEGLLFLGSFLTGEIHRITLDASRSAVVSDTAVYAHPGNILSLERGSDGTLYFSDFTGIYRLALS